MLCQYFTQIADCSIPVAFIYPNITSNIPLTGDVPLSDVPQLAELFSRADGIFSDLTRFLQLVERELCVCLRSGAIPSTDLVQAIAVAKVTLVTTPVDPDNPDSPDSPDNSLLYVIALIVLR